MSRNEKAIEGEDEEILEFLNFLLEKTEKATRAMQFIFLKKFLKIKLFVKIFFLSFYLYKYIIFLFWIFFFFLETWACLINIILVLNTGKIKS